MKEVEIYLDILKKLNYYRLQIDKGDSDYKSNALSKLCVMRDRFCNECEMLYNSDGKIYYFKLHNPSLNTTDIIVLENDVKAYIKEMSMTDFKKYYKSLFREYKLKEFLNV